jgi:cytochrome c peroxidase
MGYRRLGPASAIAVLLVGVLVASAVVTHTASPPQDIPRVPNPPPAADLPSLPGDLRAITVPEPSNLGDFVKNRPAAIALGKALFWDMQVGSDGVQACASCHFRADADPRSKNQISPGLKQVPAADLTFRPRAARTPS